MEENASSNEKQVQNIEQFEPAEPPLKGSTQEFKEKFYPHTSDAQWNDWHWQISNSITTYDELTRIFGSSDYELSRDINLPLRITPYYASTITNIHQGIGKCVIPTSDELIVTENEENDSLNEEHQSPVDCIVHRYPDRVLFLTTDFCSSYCRYCTRSHMVSHTKITRDKWDNAIKYIKEHTEIRDVLLSGGDPFTLSDESIEYLLNNIRKIEHVEIIRIGTKMPVVCPQRITENLCNILKKFHPLLISIHFSHPNEITAETKLACEMLADAGIPLGSQTVLLKNVNDNIETMKKLMHKLLMIRVRPYYIYQCDRVVGTHHFRTPISKGIEIIEGLRGWTTGYACPNFIVDSPEGKINISPNNIISNENGVYKLKSYKGKVIEYNEDN